MSRRDTRTPWERELDERRREAERADARKNQRMTRGDILDAIEAVLDRIAVTDSQNIDAVYVLQALREAFE